MAFFKKYPYYRQIDEMDCAPACLKMILSFYSVNLSISTIRDICHTSRLGTHISDIIFALDEVGFEGKIFKTSIKYLTQNKPFPCILHWRNNHFVVLFDIVKDKFIIGDPAHGIIKLSLYEFEKEWCNNYEKGIAIFIDYNSDLTLKFNQFKQPHTVKQFLLFLKPFKIQVGIMLLFILIAGVISFIIPKTIQYMTDRGIEGKNIDIIWQVLIFQLILYASLSFTNFFKNLLQARISTKLSVFIISEFLLKLLRLPISFFDSKNHGDIYQRIEDHSRIETFISSKFVSFIFSVILLLAYSVQLFLFDKYIVLTFIIFTTLSFSWFIYFNKKRKELDYKRFGLAVEERHFTNDLISGMKSIKLSNAQEDRIKKWKELQSKLYQFKLDNIKLFHIQQNGSNTIEQINTILITFLCAYWVINEKISFGIMISIGYIIGQLKIPTHEILSFFSDYQDAKISFNRLNEISQKNNENGVLKKNISTLSKGINICNLSFKYPGRYNGYVLKNLDLFIPKGKTTAIVGTSGSGKSTLIKLLLSFYKPSKGTIYFDNHNLCDINTDLIREQYGVVLQEGHIFNSSIAENIAMKKDDIDIEKIHKALDITCLSDFVNSLPQKYNTPLGSAGIELSGGQRQRLFIARAIYNNPEIIFFDEATNSLDSSTELKIVNNLIHFFNKKTVVIIAHRLSTVKNADQIVVLEDGKIIEKGEHNYLISSRGKYYNLIKDQLELDT